MGHLSGGFQIYPLPGPVPEDIGEYDHRDTQVLAPLRQINCPYLGFSDPAGYGCFPPFAGDVRSHAPGPFGASLLQKVRMDDGRRAQDHPVNPERKVVVERIHVPNPPAHLYANRGLFCNRSDRCLIVGDSFSGAVQVDEVEKLGPLIDPAQGHLHGIIAIYRLFPIIALKEPHAFSPTNIYGRDD